MIEVRLGEPDGAWGSEVGLAEGENNSNDDSEPSATTHEAEMISMCSTIAGVVCCTVLYLTYLWMASSHAQPKSDDSQIQTVLRWGAVVDPSVKVSLSCPFGACLGHRKL